MAMSEVLKDFIFIACFFIAVIPCTCLESFASNLHHQQIVGPTPYQISWINMKTNNNSYLSLTPKHTAYVKNQMQCITACLKQNGLSVNFWNHGYENYTCEVLDDDKYNKFEQFETKNGYTHFSIMSSCERKQACPHDGYSCVPNYIDNTHQCKCKPGLSEIKECKTVLTSVCGEVSDGYSFVKMTNKTVFKVLCKGGWLHLFRRFDGSIDFKQDWLTYKNGFGNITGEFWLGNERMHWLTATVKMTVKIEFYFFSYPNTKAIAIFNSFSIDDENNSYKLSITEFDNTSSNADDEMHHQNGFKFTTIDRDNDILSRNCAEVLKGGGWWFGKCANTYFTGQYPDSNQTSDSMHWGGGRFSPSLSRASIAIRHMEPNS